VLFLGYPTYSLTVMLALLVSTGIGSLRTERDVTLRVAPAAASVGLALIALLVYVAPLVFAQLLGAPLRCASRCRSCCGAVGLVLEFLPARHPHR
jgi:hypothetical protein